MMWPAWVEPAVWVFLAILAAEVGIVAWRARRGSRQMGELIRYTVQVRQALEDGNKTLRAIDERGARVTGDG